MTYSELKKKLKKAGCYFVREGHDHEIWRSPTTGAEFQVGRHKTEDVKPGTLSRIMRDAGLK